MRVAVLDASIAVKWYVHEPDRAAALDLLEREEFLFIAPDLFLAEVVNALLRQNRTGGFPDELLDDALQDLTLTCPDLFASQALMPRAAALARRLNAPIYDCLYLALAEQWDTVMITADAKFVALCGKRLRGDPILDRLRALEGNPI